MDGGRMLEILDVELTRGVTAVLALDEI